MVETAQLIFKYRVPTQACISQLKWTWFKQSRRAIDLERYDQASRGPYGSLKILFRLSRLPYVEALQVGAAS